MDNSKNLPEKSLYDPSAYTDNELYDILDLVNPTDRELEAKILMMVHKYENGTNKPSLKLARFFNDIYNHFFDFIRTPLILPFCPSIGSIKLQRAPL